MNNKFINQTSDKKLRAKQKKLNNFVLQGKGFNMK